MKISVLIPSLNQGEFLEETLLSVLGQESDKEIIVVDGGSTDRTVDILQSFEDQLAYWVSEPDRGQADALNRGLARMSGDVWVFLNSDDLLVDGAFTKVREVFARRSVEWVGGSGEVFNDSGSLGMIQPRKPDRMIDYLRPWGRKMQYVFPFSGASYMRRSVYERLGGFDETLHFCMDIDYYLRATFQLGLLCCHLSESLARWRRHPGSKTEQEGIAYGFREEEIVLARRYLGELPQLERAELKRELIFEERQTVARKACHFAAVGRGSDGREILRKAVGKDPGLMGFRPWWGAVRRCLWSK